MIAVERFWQGDRNARMRLDKAPWSARKILAQRRHASDLAPDRYRHRRRVGVLFRRRPDARPAARDCSRRRSSPMCSSASSPPPPMCLAASPASRSASICAPGRASRARCSIATRCSSPIATGAASRADRTRRGRAWEGRGDCIDCHQCIAVCPTGIDIRDGPAARMHSMRALHRCLRRDHGQGRPAARADRLRHGPQSRGAAETRRFPSSFCGRASCFTRPPW